MARYMAKNGFDVRKVTRNGKSPSITLPKEWISSEAYQMRFFKAEDLNSEQFKQLIERVKKLEDEIIILVPIK